MLAAYGIETLPIQASHTLAVLDLPGHHKDPLDRLLIAQALGEGLPAEGEAKAQGQDGGTGIDEDERPFRHGAQGVDDRDRLYSGEPPHDSR